MSFSIGYLINISKAAKKIIGDELRELGLEATEITNGKIELKSKLDQKERERLQDSLSPYGIDLVEKLEDSFVQQIKTTINDMLHQSNDQPAMKTSLYLEQKLLKSYSSIARAFKEETYTSIETYIILQKVERAKELMISDQYTLTEIAHLLNYSSVAHLSNQFKKTTGLSASAFVRILKKRNGMKSSI